jgi:hypothetical protein
VRFATLFSAVAYSFLALDLINELGNPTMPILAITPPPEIL